LLLWAVSGVCCQLVFDFWHGIFNGCDNLDHDRAMKRKIIKTVNHLVDLEDCIQYLRVRLNESGKIESEIVDKNRRNAEASLLKKMEDLCCKQQAIGCGDLTNLSKTLHHQKRIQK
jgi:hypothetical protein